MIGAHGSSLRSGRSSRVSCIRSARSSRPSISYIWCAVDVEALAQAIEHRRRRRGGHLDPDDVAEAASPELRLDRLEQIVGVVGHLEVGVARDPEQRLLGDLHPREERGQEVRDHRLEWHEPLAGGDEPVEPLRHLDAGEPLLGRVRVDGEHAERERQARRCTGTAGPSRPRAASAPGRCRSCTPPRGARSSFGVHSSIVTISIPSAASAGCSSRFQSFDCRAVSSVTRALIPASASVGERPSAERIGESRRLLVEQAGDAHHEELVQVRREDGAELDPLEQRLRLVARRGRARAR